MRLLLFFTVCIVGCTRVGVDESFVHALFLREFNPVGHEEFIRENLTDIRKSAELLGYIPDEDSSLESSLTTIFAFWGDFKEAEFYGQIALNEGARIEDAVTLYYVLLAQKKYKQAQLVLESVGSENAHYFYPLSEIPKIKEILSEPSPQTDVKTIFDVEQFRIGAGRNFSDFFKLAAEFDSSGNYYLLMYELLMNYYEDVVGFNWVNLESIDDDLFSNSLAFIELAGVVYVQLLDVGFNDVAHELRVRCEKLYSIFKRRDFYFDASDLYLIRWVVTED